MSRTVPIKESIRLDFADFTPEKASAMLRGVFDFSRYERPAGFRHGVVYSALAGDLQYTVYWTEGRVVVARELVEEEGE